MNVRRSSITDGAHAASMNHPRATSAKSLTLGVRLCPRIEFLTARTLRSLSDNPSEWIAASSRLRSRDEAIVDPLLSILNNCAESREDLNRILLSFVRNIQDSSTITIYERKTTKWAPVLFEYDEAPVLFRYPPISIRLSNIYTPYKLK